MTRIYTQHAQGHQWLQQYQGQRPILACILGFTATALIPGISAAGATPEDRKYTAIADAEFLLNGVQPKPQYPLPPLTAGASPVLISRAVVEAFDLPVYLFNAGLPQSPAVPAIDLGGVPANCLTSGNALPLDTVKHLFKQGLKWGEKLAVAADEGYVIISECVVGGTTTALSVLTGLGIAAAGKVNSSHPQCNHSQKWAIVQKGLRQAGLEVDEGRENLTSNIEHLKLIDPFQLVAAVGDPMQIVAAGMAIAASHQCGVLLAGGTQMLAVYALAQALGQLDASVLHFNSHLAAPSSLAKKGIGEGEQELEVSKLNVEPCLENLQPSTSQLTNLQPSPQPPSPSLIWEPQRVVVGTTRWVAEDPTGDTVGLARDVGSVPLLATPLSFARSRYPQLQAYEEGYVKEGVGAGGCAIAAHLYKGWNTMQLLSTIEALVERYCQS